MLELTLATYLALVAADTTTTHDTGRQTPTTTSAQTSTSPQTIGLTPYLLVIAGQGADALTTARNYRLGLVESNPMYGPHAPLGKILAIKAGETAALALLIRHFDRTGHSRAAKVLGYFGGIGGFIPAAINLSQPSRGAR